MKRAVFLLSMAFACTLAHAATVPTTQPRGQVAPFAGTMMLDVTATDVDRQIIEIRESIPVQRPGKLTLLYPQWEVGSHAPTASAAELTVSQPAVAGSSASSSRRTTVTVAMRRSTICVTSKR